ncbi:MAG: flavodoxin family protein [Candidatus Peregrinibacteria bacterium]|nr:flavodoxin family protein [Candidatus Peregrinibacteria bacterium]
MSSIHIIYASTSGHTEYVVDTLIEFLSQKTPEIAVERQRVELAKPEDLLRGDLVILGSGTWNFGGVEGQLNEYMHRYLFERAQDIDLTGKQIAFISLGDDRYYYTTRCTEKFMRFLKCSHAKMALIPLIVVNEPYGQEERIRKWGEKLIKLFEQPIPLTSSPPQHVPVA